MADTPPAQPDPQIPAQRNPQTPDSRGEIDPQIRAAQISARASLIVAIISGIFTLIIAVFAVMTRPSDAVRDANKATAELEAKVAILKDAKKFPFVPAGTIVAYGGEPNSVALKALGWLICNGESFSPIDENGKYSLLYSNIGFSWGRDNTDKSKFKVPNLEGYFLRGVDPSNDIGRFALNGGNTNGVGSYQADAVGSHNHQITFWLNGGPANNSNKPYWDLKKGHTPDTITTDDIKNSRASETRPKNACVYYIIKY